jgi:pimeloyl-ACP methyl ester carboxylesterase
VAALLLNLWRWARHTRPEPLPAAPQGSATVVTDDGTRLHAQIGGRLEAGITVVFVHGFLARTIEFDMQWNAFADRARLVRYDHRSHGRSEQSRKAVTTRILGDDLAAVIATAVPEGPVVLVGHSMGGMTALAFAAHRAAEFQNRVAGVCLIATGAGHYIAGHRWENLFRRLSRSHGLAPALLAVRMAAPTLERLRPRRTHLMRWATRKVIFGSQDVDPATLSMTQELLEEPPIATLASFQGSLMRHDARRGLTLLREIPVAIITGADDKLTRPEHSHRMAADIGPGVELVVIEGAGHVVNQTRPVEVNQAISGLLDRVEEMQRTRPGVSFSWSWRSAGFR